LVPGIVLIRWISLQAKTTLFVGQNFIAKTTLIFGTERVGCKDPNSS